MVGDPSKLAQLKLIELEQMKAFRDLLAKLKGSQEQGASVLDRTIVLFGSHLGNASSHDNRNMPILLAGGEIQARTAPGLPDRSLNPPLSNLYVQMLQGAGSWRSISSPRAPARAIPGFEMNG